MDKDSKKEKVVQIESIPFDAEAVQEETFKINNFIKNQYDREKYKFKQKKTPKNEDSP